MQSIAQKLLIFLLALLPVALATSDYAAERSTVYVTKTVKKVTTHYVTASVYVPPSTSVYSTSDVSTSSSKQVYSSVYSPSYSSYQRTFAPTGSPKPTTIVPSYTVPPKPSTSTPAPTGAAGQVGANVVLVAGAVAGIGAMML